MGKKSEISVVAGGSTLATELLKHQNREISYTFIFQLTQFRNRNCQVWKKVKKCLFGRTKLTQLIIHTKSYTACIATQWPASPMVVSFCRQGACISMEGSSRPLEHRCPSRAAVYPSSHTSMYESSLCCTEYGSADIKPGETYASWSSHSWR